MNTTSTAEIEAVKDQRSAKCCAIGWTVVYLILLPFFILVAMLSPMIFDNSRMTAPLGLWIIFMVCWIPISILVSIYLMWSNYARGHYKRTRLLWMIPFLTFGIVVLLNGLLQTLFL